MGVWRMTNVVCYDHCDKMMSEEFTKKVWIKLQRNKNYNPEDMKFDLCDDCFKSLDEWIFKVNVKAKKK